MRYIAIQKDVSPVSADTLRRAFRGLGRFTDADAIRLSQEAFGILAKDLSADEGSLFQRALQVEGIATALIPSEGLPRLVQPKFVRRMELQPEALLIYDPLGKAVPVPWEQLFLVAAGTVRHFDVSTTRSQEQVTRFDPIRGFHVQTVDELRHRVDTDQRCLLDLFLTGGAMRFQIEAEQFLFKPLFDPGDLTVRQKTAALVRLLVEHAGRAVLNRGAADLLQNSSAPPLVYPSKAAFFDESVWWLWRLQTDRP